MRPPQPLCELTIKVPGPFEGVDDLGFSARYPAQGRFAPLRDVPLWIEGPAQPLRRLHNRLRLLHEAIDGPYAWTDPVQLADEVVIVAFHDRSLEPRAAEDFAQASLDFVRAKVDSSAQPWKSAYDSMMASAYGSLPSGARLSPGTSVQCTNRSRRSA